MKNNDRVFLIFGIVVLLSILFFLSYEMKKERDHQIKMLNLEIEKGKTHRVILDENL